MSGDNFLVVYTGRMCLCVLIELNDHAYIAAY
jgi:hypothetical protein